MPIRIYALAKDLDIDSKELVDVCTRAGVTGKGSALASLTDEEVEKVKAYLAKRSAPHAPERPPTSIRRNEIEAPIRPTGPAPTTSPPVLISKKPATGGSTPIVVKPEEPQPAAPPVVVPPVVPPVVTTVAPVAQTPGPLASKTPSAVASKGSTPFSRDDYIAPAGNKFSREKEVTEAKKRPDGPRPPIKRETVVKLAAIPQSGQVEPPKPKQEATQKPIMTLPPDAISRAKQGRAPLEQFTKPQQDKKRSDRDAGPGTGKRPSGPGRGPAVPDPLAEAPLPGKVGKDRRPSKHAAGEEEVDEGGEGKKKLAGMASARATRQQKRRITRVGEEDTEEAEARRRRKQNRPQLRKGSSTAAPRKDWVIVEVPCTVRSLSEASGVPTAQIQRALMSLGTMAAINSEIDQEMAELVVAELGLEVEFRQVASLEESMLSRFESEEDDPADLVTRPPIITFLGHVDHGKTSLLDKIIGINVVSGEAGGITQHIRAYKLEKEGREIAFVDTPGHEAFTEMRARGANVTDIAVLVVAADDGVMPQTEEAISHARAANVPIVVALNKVDLPSADVTRALQDLSTHGLLPTEWGGDVEVVKTSAVTGEGLDTLLETLLLTAEIHEFKANPRRAASGICLEAQQEGDRGVLAKLVVKNGTLRIGDVVVCGSAYGKVKALYDTLDVRKRLTEAGPSTPVSVIGLDQAPQAGEPFHVITDIAHAREIAESRERRTRSRSLSGKTVRVSFEEFQRRLEEGQLGVSHESSTLNLILRADVRGSIEAIQKELGKLEHPEVRINILQATVGGITSADVTLADASDAVIVGFNVIPDENARSLAEQRGVEIRRYDIIYKVTEDLKLLLEGKLKPEEHVQDLGRALVQRLFTISRVGTIAGCRVLAGKIERGCRMRVNRDGRGIGEYGLDSLKREKDDAKEVREGFECGIKLVGFNDLKEGDILEAYKIEERKRTL